MAYDAENRVLTAPGVQYAYDSRNKRVWKGTFSGSTLTAQEAYFYGVDGRKLGTYSLTLNGSLLTATTTQTAVFFGGKRVAVDGAAFVPDRLGSNTAGKYFPYGEDRGTPIANDQVKYATYTRDSATGLDYADQRYYSNQFGRFMSPDPYRSSTASVNNPFSPQSWNRYAYVLGDPINLKDPRGRDSESADDENGPPDPGWPPLLQIGRPPNNGDPTDKWSPAWAKAYAKLSNANDLVQKLLEQDYAGTLSSDCQTDLQAIQNATGIGLLGIAYQVNNSDWEDGTASQDLYRDLFVPSNDALSPYVLAGSVSIQNAMRNSFSSGTRVVAALPGSALAGTIFFNPGYVNQNSTGYDAALLMHEAIHNLGAQDPALMGALGFDPNDPITDKATHKLATDCFGVSK